MLKLKHGSCITVCFKDQKQSHLGGVLPKIQGIIASRKENWAGDLSTTHQKKELFAIPSLSDLHRRKTSQSVGVFARILLFRPSTCFIRYFHNYMCKFWLTLLYASNFSKVIRNIFLLSLLMLARTSPMICKQNYLALITLLAISVFKMTPSWTSPKSTAIVMSNRICL